ncbi:MAG: transcription elongation factor GreA [Thermodesulfovibrio sp.]|jgi:transcription elongation factor GreA|uniref:transcription elongation factor GreA n=2 Tax=unclassified Thermodesulfovibrio TaxID=2645936 RepID=UPI002483134D|nr:transcription elongation factor GreA [Thermodesulfovibrio sp. 1176]MDI1472777.1 transcription elongation factor GreA [Thermodesulfovibrio sp. 1176]MDI6713476.1 transcription elongation factor GreA [Thermodesulfovibrio sp.]
MERIPMTPEGYEKLKEELDRLIKIERPAVIKAIAEARAHGDLSENAEYHAAREKQSFIEGRIQELQAKLARAQVIDPAKINHDKVAFGAKVKVLDLDTEEEKEFHLVGPDEADVKNGKISITSPVGKALIGKEVGEQVTIKAPAKTFNYEIISISFE